MSRTTDAAVRAIIVVDKAITDLTPYMDAAHYMVDQVCTDITEENATLVETWLSAHYVTIRDPRTSSEGVSGISASYQGVVGLALNSSIYGQQAMAFDMTGGLARWNAQIISGKTKRPAGITWMGTSAELE